MLMQKEKMLKYLVLVCVLSVNVFYADVEDHLKKIENKSDSHKMRNIDFIYVINLDQRPEKFESCLNELTPYGINPYRFSAVNGWELTLEAINDLGIKYDPWMKPGIWGTSYLPQEGGEFHHEVIHVPGRTYFSHCMSRGAIGIALSHLSILQDAYDSGYNAIWVMEDDIEVMQNPHILSDLIDELDDLVGKNGWDILFTDRDTKDNKGNNVPCSSFAARPNYTPSNQGRFAEVQVLSPNLRKIGSRYGAYSMIVRRSGMKKMLRFLGNKPLFSKNP